MSTQHLVDFNNKIDNNLQSISKLRLCLSLLPLLHFRQKICIEKKLCNLLFYTAKSCIFHKSFRLSLSYWVHCLAVRHYFLRRWKIFQNCCHSCRSENICTLFKLIHPQLKLLKTETLSLICSCSPNSEEITIIWTQKANVIHPVSCTDSLSHGSSKTSSSSSCLSRYSAKT